MPFMYVQLKIHMFINIMLSRLYTYLLAVLILLFALQTIATFFLVATLFILLHTAGFEFLVLALSVYPTLHRLIAHYLLALFQVYCFDTLSRDAFVQIAAPVFALGFANYIGESGGR